MELALIPIVRMNHTIPPPTNKKLIMKNKYCQNLLKTPLVAFALATGIASAGTTETAAPAAPPAEDVISGVLSLSANSHFISYGNDVWKDGSSMSDLGFNPSLEFTFKLPAEGFSLILGTWWDVNSKGAPSIGGDIQEIDVWAGIGYSIDKFSITTTYQAWNYNRGTEEIIDVKLAYDCLLSPSLMFHNRIDEGNSGGANGTIMVLGLSHTIEAGPVSISFPVNFAAILGDNYYRATAPGSDSGYAYTSVGAQISYPLAFMGESYGKWSLNGGVTQYWTNGPVIPGNPTNNFLTYNFGLAASF